MAYIKKKCLFCANDKNLETLYARNFDERKLTPQIFSARRVTEHFHYQIVRCKECGLVFSREILEDKELARLYGQSEFTYSDYAHVIRRDYWRPLKPYISAVSKGSALEIGCGNGFFLEELVKQGFQNVMGCEPSLDAKQKACPDIRENISLGFFREGDYEKNSFDLICSFQTLDHMPDPQAILESTYRLIKPGGWIYLVVHDVDSLQARLLREYSPIIDIEHIYLFNKRTLRRLLEQTGFNIVRISELENSYPMEYWFKMAPMPSLLKQFGKSFLKWTGIGKIALPLKVGNIVALAKRNK